MNAAEIMDRAVYVYKKSFWKQLAFAAIFGVISYVASTILSFVFPMLMAFFLAFNPAFTGGLVHGIGTIISMTLLVLVVVFFFVFLWYAISSAGHSIIAGPVFFGYKAKFPFKQLPRMVGRIFCTLLAKTIASLPFVGIAVLFAVSGMFQTLIAWAPWVFVLVSFILLVIYLLYLNVFSLSIAVAVFERKTFFNALIRSWQLINGEYWKIAGMRLVWLLLTGIIYTALAGVMVLATVLAVSIVTSLDMGVAGVIIIGITTILTVLITFAASFMIGPLDGVFHTTLYFNQRIKREGLDIESRLGRLSL